MALRALCSRLAGNAALIAGVALAVAVAPNLMRADS